jgi:hypothetical protein
MNESVPPPPGWGQDSLTQFLDSVRRNQFATFANKKLEMKDLIFIDVMFTKLEEGQVTEKFFAPMTFLHRAHSAYRAAVGAVCSGQIYEAQALLRSCLEHAAYAFHIADEPARYEVWLNRHEGMDTKKSVQTEFMWKKIIGALTAKSEEIGSLFSRFYEQTIDYGAHPNERGFSLNSEVAITDGGEKRFSTVYLQSDGLALDLGLKSAAQVGLLVLSAAALIDPARMQQLGIDLDLAEMLRRFSG